ncbi:PepSY domain-containing protein [Allorhizobium taibaishanense]|nr:hypothetical protein [Allorhizobium taibaishanense]
MALSLSCSALVVQDAFADGHGGPPGGRGGDPPTGGQPGGGPGGGMGGPPGGPPGGFGFNGGAPGRDSSGHSPSGNVPSWRSDPPTAPDSSPENDLNMVRPQVLDGVKSGRYRSLREVLANVNMPEGSRLIDVDLRHMTGGDFYLLTIKDVSGRFRTLKVDARTGKPP